MLIVEVIGGLGNQMFQYAFFYALRKHYKNDKLNLFLNRFKETDDNQGYELKLIFNIDEPVYEDDVVNLIDNSKKLKDRFRRKLFGVKPTYFCENIFRYNPRVFKTVNSETIYYRGLWQDELYFKDYRTDLLEIFKFKSSLDEKNLKVLGNIESTNSVSIHIRRGDYISNKKYQNILGNICTYEYYREAVSVIDSQVSDISLFVFSDDIEWVKSNFDFLNNYSRNFVNHNKGNESYIDMQLMSNCKHNIIANSSFSWWGAWLNRNPSKIVLAPNKWFKNIGRLENNHIVPDNWIKINN